MIRCRYRKDVGQIPFVGKKIFIVALDHQHLCHDGCGDHNQNVRKQIEDDQQIRQLRKLGKEESEASESAHENGGTVQQRHVFPACFPLMFQTFF